MIREVEVVITDIHKAATKLLRALSEGQESRGRLESRIADLVDELREGHEAADVGPILWALVVYTLSRVSRLGDKIDRAEYAWIDSVKHHMNAKLALQHQARCVTEALPHDHCRQAIDVLEKHIM